jgi:hypothetical protein
MSKGRKAAEEVFGGKVALQNLEANAKKCLSATNALAYHIAISIATLKSFI